MLTDASGKVEASHIYHSKQVLARATILLRLATGSVSALLKESDIDFGEELEFWWNSAGVRRRLWGVVAAPESFTDLWVNVEEALADVTDWLQSMPADGSHSGFWTAHPQAGWTLSTVERAFLWGFT